jgi:acyl dehydratase
VSTLERLEAGHELPPLTVVPITRGVLAEFAAASGDDNPIHVDPAAARAAGEDDVIAHGMLSMAYLGRLLTDRFDQALLRRWTVRFTAKTPVEAAVTCRGRVLEVTSSDGTTQAEIEIETRLADGTVTLRGRAVLAEPASGPTSEEIG